MGIEQIGTQYYVVRYLEEDTSRFAILDGPYPEKAQAISMGRLRDMN